MTLRLRFAVWVAALLAFVLAAFGAFVYLRLASSVSASIDDSLRLGASQAVATVNVEDGKIDASDSIPEGSAAATLRERGLTVRVLGPGGEALQAYGLFSSLPTDAADLAAAESERPAFATVVDPASRQPVRVYTEPVVDNGRLVGMVQVMRTMADFRATLRQLLAALLVGGPVLMLVGGLGSYVLAARALAPIDHITRTAGEISADDLSARLDLPPTDDEVGRLAGTLDNMLGRLDDSFRRQRQFTADASHELRTPLAAMQAILSVTSQRRRTPQEYEEAMLDLSGEVGRLRSVAEGLLWLARGDNRNVRQAHRPVDLSVLLQDVSDSMRPLAEQKGLDLHCDVDAELAVIGDSDGLIRLFLNLVDNAIKNTESGRVLVTARGQAGEVVITVTDSGSGIAAEHLPHIFDRFYRAESSRAGPGAGLGLSIAQGIARQHGGRIDVQSAVGQGTTFTVTLKSRP